MEDLDIIQNLIDHGPSFLTTLNDTIKINYEKLYLLEEDIFGLDNIQKYLKYISEVQNIWKDLSNQLTNTELLDIVIKMLSSTENTKIKLIIIEPKCVQELFSDNLILWSLLLTLSKEITYTHIKNYQIIIKKIITNKNESRNTFVNYCSNILNKSIGKINIDFNHYDSTLPNDYELTNLLMIFLHFWEEGITDERLKALDYSYIVSEGCPIKFMSKKNIPKKNYTFLNQILFLIFDALRVGYIPILYRTLAWPTLLEDIEEEITKIINNAYNPLAKGYFLKQLENQKKIISEHLISGKTTVNNHELNSAISSFYTMICKWLQEQAENGNIIDDMLHDFVKFFSHTKDIQLTNEIISFGTLIISSKKYTANIDARIEFAIFIGNKYIENKIIIDLSKYLCGLIITHNDLHSSNLRIDYKYMNKQDIYSLIRAVYLKRQDNIYLLTNNLKDNIEPTKKFLNIICMDLTELSDMIDEYRNNSNNNSNNNNNYNYIVNFLKYYTNTFSMVEKIINYCIDTPVLISVINSKEISLAISHIINYLIKNDFSEYMELDSLDKLIITIGKLLTSLNIINYDFEYLIDSYNFKIENYENYCTKSSYNIGETINKIKEKIIEINNRKEEKEINYPDEFIDPITYCPIDEPCLLPQDTDFSGDIVFFDKSTITKQLLIKDENPYTREVLTIDQFNEYNSRPEIVIKLQDFKKQLQDFKKQL